MFVMDVFGLVVRKTAEGYIAKSPDGSIVTGAEDFEALVSMVRDAVECHFEEGDRPKSIRLTVEVDGVTVP